jgi:hypothetical protein
MARSRLAIEITEPISFTSRCNNIDGITIQSITRPHMLNRFHKYTNQTKLCALPKRRAQKKKRIKQKRY